MGSRRGGRKTPRSNFDQILRRRIASASAKNCATVELLVDYLRSKYPCYIRHKVQPFAKRVQQIVHSSRDVDGADTPSRNKWKKTDAEEERVQLIEAQHMRKRTDVQNMGGGRSSLSSVASTSSLYDEEGSNSEDVMHGEKFEPEFDLMKSLVRENLLQKSKDLGKGEEVKEAVGLDIVYNNQDRKNVNLMSIEGQPGDCLNNSTKNDNSGGTKGPMFKDLGGMRDVIRKLMKEFIVPLHCPHLHDLLGLKRMTRILLHGPPGCGKTKLANAIANETGFPFYQISCVAGVSEEKLQELFSKAHRTAPSIVFIDEIDAIPSKPENLQKEIVTQLKKLQDDVLLVVATSRPDVVDPALRMQFDREIILGVPDEGARVEILSILTLNMKVERAFDFMKIARATSGFVGTDLVVLTRIASNLASQRIISKKAAELSKEPIDNDYTWSQEEVNQYTWSHEEVEDLSVTMADFEEAAKSVVPALKKEGFSAIPDVKWDDVGGLHWLRHEFDRYIVKCIKDPERCKYFGEDSDTGILLYGPPGCGKTFIAKAVANEAGANFIYIKGPELLNKYVGESELAVRAIFSRARTCAPCILFFDEVDSLTTKRGKEGGWVVERVVTQLLLELDGAEQRRGVYVIGATNRPDVMDHALLRPGRFGEHMYVPLPGPDERGMILIAHARKRPVDPNVDLMALGRDVACENFSGADLKKLMREAALAARDGDKSCRTITEAHFKIALEKISPSVSDEDIKYYNRMSEHFRRERF